MAFLERLKLRRGAHGGDAGAPSPLPVAPRLKTRITEFSQLFAPGLTARKLKPSQGLEGAPDPATIFTRASMDGGQGVGAHRQIPLDQRVWDSAQRIYDRPGEMRDGARAVAAAADDRVDGSVSLTAWTLRVVIGLAWTALAAQLVAAELFGTADGAATQIYGLGRIAPRDWLPLAEIFGIAGGAAIIAAFAGAALVMFGGNGDNKRVRARSEELGQTAADLAREFDESLDELRRGMDERARPVDAVADLSQSHLTAVEAAVFFRNIQFVADVRDAPQKFIGYIRRSIGGGASAADEFQAFVLGLLVGGGVAVGVLADGIDLSDIPSLDGLNPAAEAWILIGTLFYLFAGALAQGFRGLYLGAVTEGVYREALEAFRSGYVSRKPPRIEDVVRRINDALEVYKARVGAGGGQAAVNAVDETPSWRRGPEAPRFVETGFQAAPKSFRADPPADENRSRRKIF